MINTIREFKAQQNLQQETTLLEQIKTFISDIDYSVIMLIVKTLIRILNKPFSVYSWVQGGYDLTFVGYLKDNSVLTSVGNIFGTIGNALITFKR